MEYFCCFLFFLYVYCLCLMACFHVFLSPVIRITCLSELKLFGRFIFIGVVAKAVGRFSIDFRKYFRTNQTRGQRFDVHIFAQNKNKESKKKDKLTQRVSREENKESNRFGKYKIGTLGTRASELPTKHGTLAI